MEDRGGRRERGERGRELTEEKRAASTPPPEVPALLRGPQLLPPIRPAAAFAPPSAALCVHVCAHVCPMTTDRHGNKVPEMKPHSEGQRPQSCGNKRCSAAPRWRFFTWKPGEEPPPDEDQLLLQRAATSSNNAAQSNHKPRDFIPLSSASVLPLGTLVRVGTLERCCASG